MARSTATVEVEYNGETIDVPTAFEIADFGAYFGGVPDSFEVERIFRYDGGLWVESYLGDEEWVEALLHTDDHHPIYNAEHNRGWIAQVVQSPRDGPGPGETLWERD